MGKKYFQDPSNVKMSHPVKPPSHYRRFKFKSGEIFENLLRCEEVLLLLLVAKKLDLFSGFGCLLFLLRRQGKEEKSEIILEQNKQTSL